MSVKEVVRRQHAQMLDQAATRAGGQAAPAEGWIATMRRALDLSGADLARRAGVTRAAIHQAERNEREGAISIRQMQKLADALGGRFVYAIVPDTGRIDDLIEAQARRKAERIVGVASVHMALESQSLSSKQIDDEIGRLSQELIQQRPPDFWRDP